MFANINIPVNLHVEHTELPVVLLTKSVVSLSLIEQSGQGLTIYDE